MGRSSPRRSAYLPVPPSAALEIPDYPQFERVPVPNGSDAALCLAWNNTPFADDAAGRAFLRRIEAKLPFDVVEGQSLLIPLWNTRHWADHWLVGMGMRFVFCSRNSMDRSTKGLCVAAEISAAAIHCIRICDQI